MMFKEEYAAFLVGIVFVVVLLLLLLPPQQQQQQQHRRHHQQQQQQQPNTETQPSHVIKNDWSFIFQRSTAAWQPRKPTHERRTRFCLTFGTQATGTSVGGWCVLGLTTLPAEGLAKLIPTLPKSTKTRRMKRRDDVFPHPFPLIKLIKSFFRREVENGKLKI